MYILGKNNHIHALKFVGWFYQEHMRYDLQLSYVTKCNLPIDFYYIFSLKIVFDTFSLIHFDQETDDNF